MLSGLDAAGGTGSRGGEPAGSFGRGQRATGLGGFLCQQSTGVGGAEQASVDVSAVEDAAGDQAVEADPGLVQGVVAAAFGGVGDGSQFLVEDGLAVGMASRSRATLCRGSWL
jgi:hypothetical protein